MWITFQEKATEINYINVYFRVILEMKKKKLESDSTENDWRSNVLSRFESKGRAGDIEVCERLMTE